MSSSNSWFEVDKTGLSKLLARKGKEFILHELLQNAWDEPGVTHVSVRIARSMVKGETRISVEDNAPNGFQNIAHAYTLFAESNKKADPEKRGRFNLGEKLVLAIAQSASIETTNGAYLFDKDGRHHYPRRKRAAGSLVTVLVTMTEAETMAMKMSAVVLLPPANVKTLIDDIELHHVAPLKEFTCTLPTELADGEGHLRAALRMTKVRAYSATVHAPAAIYELGIPVCAIDGRWRFDVQQKIPLTIDRENVTLAFQRALYAAGADALRDFLVTQDANAPWATHALDSGKLQPETVKTIVAQKFGDRAVIYDPSDPEANKLAVAAGFHVIHGSSLSAESWASVKAAGAVLPAGQVTPSPKPYGENGVPLKLVKEVTPGMRAVEAYAVKFLRQVLNVSHAEVTFAADPTWPFAATYGPHHLTFNVGRLGKAWFDLKGNQLAIDDLLIHEFGHHYESDHLSAKYYDALTRIGAGLAAAIREGRI